jgi:hypothetical protein
MLGDGYDRRDPGPDVFRKVLFFDFFRFLDDGEKGTGDIIGFHVIPP